MCNQDRDHITKKRSFPKPKSLSFQENSLFLICLQQQQADSNNNKRRSNNQLKLLNFGENSRFLVSNTPTSQTPLYSPLDILTSP